MSQVGGCYKNVRCALTHHETFNLRVLNGDILVGWIDGVEGSLLENALKSKIYLGYFHVLWEHVLAHVLYYISIKDAYFDVI